MKLSAGNLRLMPKPIARSPRGGEIAALVDEEIRDDHLVRRFVRRAPSCRADSCARPHAVADGRRCVVSEHHWMQTVSGRKFFPDAPEANAIAMTDIAHALSLVCRFGGHTRELYSVAQHSVIVCDTVKTLGGSADEVRWALLHDASEAYIGDVVWPLKQSANMRGYKEVEAGVMRAISERFRLDGPEPPIVKRADLIVLSTEKRDLMRERDGIQRQIVEANSARDRLGSWHSDAFEPLAAAIIPWASNDAARAFELRFRTYFPMEMW